MTMPSEKKDPRKVSPIRIALWVLVSGFAIYMIVSGVIGVINNG
jgi:hypothetical protein